MTNTHAVTPFKPGVLKISPSLAAGNILKLHDEVLRINDSGADAIHFDAMDGHFVPLLTLGVPFLEAIRKLTTLHLDVHIMVTNPEQVAQHYLDAGADTLTFHPEVAFHAHRLCGHIRALGKRAGLALNPGTPWQSVEPMLHFVDQVTVMAVNPGYSRQAHIPEMTDKISALSARLKSKGLAVDIQVDGGVNSLNAQRLVRSGATHLVAGGAVMGTPDYRKSISEIRAMGKEC
jgi:ribulose-phosphate 3-epimerase